MENYYNNQGTCVSKKFGICKKIALKYCPCDLVSQDTAMEGLLLLGLVAYVCIHTDIV